MNFKANEQPRTIVSATDPVFTEADRSAVRLMVLFEEFKEAGPVPFIAHRRDSENHGRELYQRAVDGEFGEIGPYVAPPKQVRAREPRSRRQSRAQAEAR